VPKNFAILLTREWINIRTEGESTEQVIDLPVIGRDEFDNLPKDLTSTTGGCFEGLSEEEGERYAYRLIWDFHIHTSMLESISDGNLGREVERTIDPD